MLEAARDAVVAIETALRRVIVESKKACDDADAADDQPLKEGRSPSPLTRPNTAPSVTGADPSPAQLCAIITDAQSAQAALDKERTAVKGVYDRVDSARKAALALQQSTDIDLVIRSNGLQRLAKEARAAASREQQAANDFGPDRSARGANRARLLQRRTAARSPS